MLVAGAIVGDDRIVQRSGGPALSSDFGGDALVDLRRQARIDQDRRFRLAEHVDESGRDDFALGVDGALARGGGKIADGSDPAVANSDVT